MMTLRTSDKLEKYTLSAIVMYAHNTTSNNTFLIVGSEVTCVVLEQN